jgi:SfnB family sulfur acquisition oxidoreductase
MSHSIDAPSVPRLETDAEILAAAQAFADSVLDGAIERDRERLYPADEMARLGRTGLLGIVVPRRYGGAEASNRTIGEVFRTIAQADPSIAQLLVGHFALVPILTAEDNPELTRAVFADVLEHGARIGAAVAERGTRNASLQRTALTVRADGSGRLNGRKYYTTGCFGADWLLVLALLDGDTERPVWATVAADAPGLEFPDDWDAFGQRTTMSGSLILDDVPVAAGRIIDPGPPPTDPGPTTFGAYDQLLHLAIDVGIARAALEDGAEFVRTRSRPWFEAAEPRADQEPHVILRFGQMTARLQALEATFRWGADTLDTTMAAPELTDENTAAASLAVAAAKALSAEVAIEIANGVLELAGASATDAKHGLDRHWRNVRTHSLHDPARWKYVHIGNHTLHGINPPRSPRI